MNTVNYLRISLIDRCNFRCSYCMPEAEELAYLQSQETLTDTELLYLVRGVFVPLGINRFRLTGGEPLLRRGVVSLVEQLVQTPGVMDVSLTTNGYLLEHMAADLYQAGLRRINISLDSLEAQTFRKITGRDQWQRVWAGIERAHQAGFDPLKLNVVILPGVNDHEVVNLAALTLERAWHVRFIEFMPIGNTGYFDQVGWVSSEQIRAQLRAHFGLTTGACFGNGPAEVFQLPGAKGTVGFISQMSECFCDRCNRVRLSADGLLRPCLLNESGQVDLKTLLRTGVRTELIQQQVTDLLVLKQDIHFKERDRGHSTGAYARTMSQIGG